MIENATTTKELVALLRKGARDLDNEASNFEEQDDTGHLVCCGNNFANFLRNQARLQREAANRLAK